MTNNNLTGILIDGDIAKSSLYPMSQCGYSKIIMSTIPVI